MIQINLNTYSDSLKAKIQSDITALEKIMKIEHDENYSRDKIQIIGGQVNIEFDPPPIEYIKYREISKCFKSIVGSLQDYLDQLIAWVELSKEEIIPIDIKNSEDLLAFISNKYQEKLMDVSTRRSFNTPKKLSFLLPEEKDQAILESAQSLFNIRNGIEHHKGIASSDKYLHFRRLAIVSTSGKEIGLSGSTGPDEGINLTSKEERIKYDKGNELQIEKDQLYDIVMNLFLFTIETLKLSASKLIDAKKDIQ